VNVVKDRLAIGDTMAKSRVANTRLAGVIAEAGLSHAQVARLCVRVALESGADELAGVGRSHVSHWVAGTRPSGRAPLILCEALSRHLGRHLNLADIGLADPTLPADLASPPGLDWRVDPLITLASLADPGNDELDLRRRRELEAAAYSVADLALPSPSWWQQMAGRSGVRTATGSRSIGSGDVDAVCDMAAMFSRIDQRRGGGHARTAVVQYLTSDVLGYLRGSFRDDLVRRNMFSAAGEMAYVAGWMAFDNCEHATAQRYFTAALKLAAEADDPPLAGHILRAMAHQAVDLGHHQQALDLATASLDGNRYAQAGSRERALLGVIYARALAVTEQSRAAATALLRAEDDLAAAKPGDGEPGRMFFFGEASLAHETACTLRDLGDLAGAIRWFRRSVRTRKAATFTRTHAVTLGYLAAVQVQQNDVDQACATWSSALDSMDGIRSGRTRQVATEMRELLAPFQRRGIKSVNELDARAAAYLAAVP
jgi:tetratricopeptide (TPR) repeat protein